MELGVVVGFGYWGYEIGTNTILKILLAICIPVLGFGFWGFFDFRNFGKMSESLRLIQEIVISLLAAAAFYSTRQYFFGWLLAIISIIYHILVYILGERLLKVKS